MTETPSNPPTTAGRSALSILAVCIALASFLVALRVKSLGYGFEVLWTPWQIQRTLGASFFDLVFVESITVAVLLACALLRRRPRGLRLVTWGFYVCSVFTLLMSIINLEASRLLSTPVNYQWLYYSDFLTSFDANQAVSDTVTTTLVLGVLACQAGMFVVAWLLTRGLGRVIVGKRTATLATLGLSAASWAYFAIAGPYMIGRSDYVKYANPICAFVASVITAEQDSLSTIDTPYGNDDFQTVAQRGETRGTPGDPRIQNVVMFVFESVPAFYCETYGGKDPVTPRLKEARQHALQFSRIYSHAPSTNKAVVSIACSVYPWISFRSISREFPALKADSIADALKPHGFRTAMYHAADLRFQNMGDFLDGRGFDVMVDRRTMPRVPGKFDSDDEAAAAAFVEWCGQQSDAPFFGIFWTRATHMPYYSRGKLSYGKRDREHIRYLNALQDGDASLGVVLDGLKARGLSETTLVVVLGDHGEAFGQHDQRGHGVAIYEENVHIPLLLINPKIYKGGESHVVGGTIDIGPTILDLLGKPMPGEWQGRSLFAKNRPPRTYFFAPWSQNVFGYRDQDQKFIFNASKMTWEHYDLAKDPLELHDLVDDSPASKAAVREAENRLASWVQAQIEFMRARDKGSR